LPPKAAGNSVILEQSSFRVSGLALEPFDNDRPPGLGQAVDGNERRDRASVGFPKNPTSQNAARDKAVAIKVYAATAVKMTWAETLDRPPHNLPNV
jgi:hypothetical protein